MNSSEEKVSSWLARIIAADNWKPSANSKISSSAIDFMDMYTQVLELSVETTTPTAQKQKCHRVCSYDEEKDEEEMEEAGDDDLPRSLPELVEKASPEIKERLSEVILRYCRLVAMSVCEGLVYRDIEHVQAHMISDRGLVLGVEGGGELWARNKNKDTRGGCSWWWRWWQRKRRRVAMVVPAPLPSEPCVKCNDVDHIYHWAVENGLCTEEDQELLTSCLRGTKAFLSSWCAVYPCHVVRRALRWGAMKPVLGVGGYLDAQLCAVAGELKPRVFTEVAVQVWDDVMRETSACTRAWNRRRARKIVSMIFDYFYAGGEGLSARALESSTSFQKLKEYLRLGGGTK